MSSTTVEVKQTTTSSVPVTSESTVGTGGVGHQACVLVFIDSQESEDIDIFIIPQEKVTKTMRQLFTASLSSEPFIKEEDVQEWTEMLEEIEDYRLLPDYKPPCPPQLIVERIRARY